MNQGKIFAVLFTLVDLARADVPAHAGELGARVGLSATEAGEILVHLERRGLVDAARARLTMRGLAIAQALLARSSRGVASRAA